MLCRIGSREGMVIFYGSCVIAVGGGCRLTVRGSSSQRNLPAEWFAIRTHTVSSRSIKSDKIVDQYVIFVIH